MAAHTLSGMNKLKSLARTLSLSENSLSEMRENADVYLGMIVIFYFFPRQIYNTRSFEF